MAPVDDAPGDQLGIGHEHRGVFAREHLGVADVDLLDHALALADLDGVPGLDGAAKEQDQAADEVVDRGLQAKADADRQAAGHHGDAGQRQPQHRQGEDCVEAPPDIGADPKQGGFGPALHGPPAAGDVGDKGGRKGDQSPGHVKAEQQQHEFLEADAHRINARFGVEHFQEHVLAAVLVGEQPQEEKQEGHEEKGETRAGEDADVQRRPTVGALHLKGGQKPDGERGKPQGQGHIEKPRGAQDGGLGQAQQGAHGQGRQGIGQNGGDGPFQGQVLGRFPVASQEAPGGEKQHHGHDRAGDAFGIAAGFQDQAQGEKPPGGPQHGRPAQVAVAQGQPGKMHQRGGVENFADGNEQGEKKKRRVLGQHHEARAAGGTTAGPDKTGLGAGRQAVARPQPPHGQGQPHDQERGHKAHARALGGHVQHGRSAQKLQAQVGPQQPVFDVLAQESQVEAGKK